MAKGQQKSNREAKKPKATKTAAKGGSAASTTPPNRRSASAEPQCPPAARGGHPSDSDRFACVPEAFWTDGTA